MPISEEVHTATVTANDDPETRGRIRCSCVGLLADEDGELPMWIEPELQWGWFIVPDVGEIVEIVATVQGDTDDSFGQTSLENPNLRWKGVRHWSEDQDGDTPRTVPEDFTATNYGKRRGFATPAGHVLLFDDTEGKEKVSITHHSQSDDKFSSMSIDEDGSVVLANKNGSLIYLNAKQGQIAMIDEHGNSYTSDADGIRLIDAFANIIDMKDGDIQLIGQGNIIATCADFTAASGSYSHGDGATEPTVLGTKLLTWLAAHTHTDAMGGTGPPAVLPIPSDFLSVAGKLT